MPAKAKDEETKTSAHAPREAEYKKWEDETAKALAEQPKVRVRLFQNPADSSDKPLPDVTVAVNGHVYLLQRGHSLEVPETVADILAQAGHV